MARFDSDDGIRTAKKPRRPWRLWLVAIVMTAAAAFGAYNSWHYRGEIGDANDAKAKCETSLADEKKISAGVADANKKVAACLAERDAANKKAADAANLSSALTIGANAAKDDVETGRAIRQSAERRQAVIEELQRQLTKMLETKQATVSARRGQFVLTIPADNLFAAGLSDLAKPAEMIIVEVGFALKRFGDRRFQITVHTDDIPLKGAAYKDNLELSAARAVSLARVLVQAGVDAKNVVAAGAGEGDPLSKDPKDKARNRRIEIALLPTIGELPPLPTALGLDTARGEIPVEKPDAAGPAPAPVAPAPAAAPAKAAPAPAPAPTTTAAGSAAPATPGK